MKLCSFFTGIILSLVITTTIQANENQTAAKHAGISADKHVKKKVFVFLFNGFSDWEIAYLSPEINKNDAFELIYFAQTREVVSSMGGMTVLPDISMEEINLSDVEMLILPGGTAWEKDENDFIDTMVENVFTSGKTIAAICAATVYLGKKGFLNHLNHTSNDLYYLQGMAPEYSGGNFYVNSKAVTDKNVITANGTAPIEFAREIFKALKLFSDDDIEKWFQLFKHGVWSE